MSALKRLIDNPRELTLELVAQITREHVRAVDTARRIAGGESLHEIEEAALEPLRDWIDNELHHRSKP